VRSRRKRLGQHFLRDVSIAEYIAGLVPGGLDVIEVGPGRGILTIPLAQKSRVVYAIEVDPALADALRRTAPPNVVVIEGDALELEWPKADFFVSNVPYSITSPLLLRLAESKLPAVVTVQREVAERLAARPGDENYGRLTVAMQCRYQVEVLRVVPPRAFEPPPRVYSAVVRLTPRSPCGPSSRRRGYTRRWSASRPGALAWTTSRASSGLRHGSSPPGGRRCGG